jgi:hypothetical protein
MEQKGFVKRADDLKQENMAMKKSVRIARLTR